MNGPRHPIAASLRDNTENLEFGTPPVDEIVTRGRRARRGRVLLTATTGIAAVTLAGGIGWAAVSLPGGNGSGDAPYAESPKPSVRGDEGSPGPTETSEASPSPWPPAGVTLTPCDEIPRLAEPGAIDDFTVDVQHGILTFTFPTAQGERTVDIAYERDQQCRRHPDVRRLLERVEGALG